MAVSKAQRVALMAVAIICIACQFEGTAAARHLACVDTYAACAPWGPGQCATPGVASQCPCMCPGNGPTPTGPDPNPGPNPTPGCVDSYGACPGWGPGSCGIPGVATYCPCMCNNPNPNPDPDPTPAPPISGIVKGYWWKTWQGSSAPAGTNMGIAFSGLTDPAGAVRDSLPLKGKLPGSKYISLGGGNAAGMFSKASLNSITAAIKSGTFSGYVGLVYDIEEGESGLADAFKASFAAAKAKGFKVLVTISHSQPYGIGDAQALMSSFFSNGNIDYISPQLYTSGMEGANDYTAVGTQWSDYARSKAKVIPSIVRGSMYNDAVNYFKSKGVTLAGYIQWATV